MSSSIHSGPSSSPTGIPSQSSSSSSAAAAAAAAAGVQSQSSVLTSHLSNASLNLFALRESSRQELLQIFQVLCSGSSSNKVGLILDKSLSLPLSCVAEMTFLKSAGHVEQIHYLQPEVLPYEPLMPNYLFLVRSLPLSNIALLTDQIHRIRKLAAQRNQRTSIGLAFVPRCSFLCRRLCEEYGFLGDVDHCFDYNLDLIALDSDVLSMEAPNAFQSLFVDNDVSFVYFIAKALMKIQALYGLIPNVKGKGSFALRIFQLMNRMRRETEAGLSDDSAEDSGSGAAPNASASAGRKGGDESKTLNYENISSENSRSFSSIPSEIDTLILIDRSADFLTPMLTQRSYEGLIDECFGVKSPFVELDSDLVSEMDINVVPNPAAAKGAAGTPAGSPSAVKRKRVFNSSDSIFKEIRDLNFRLVGPSLHKKAEFLKSTHHQASTMRGASTSEMHSFYFQKFKTYNQIEALVETHIKIGERLKHTLTRGLDRKIEVENALLDCEGDHENHENDFESILANPALPMSAVIRMMCLFSLTFGIRPKKFEAYKRDFLHSFGFEHLATLHQLERLGLFIPKSNKSFSNVYPMLRKRLKLTENASIEQMQQNAQNVMDVAQQEISLIYNGYVPLSIRLIELAQRWRALIEILQMIPGGKAFEFYQQKERKKNNFNSAAIQEEPLVNLLEMKSNAQSTLATPQTSAPSTNKPNTPAAAATTPAAATPAGTNAAAATSGAASAATATNASVRRTKKKPLTLVFFVGGVTFSEVSALRMLSDRDDHEREYIVATTKLINGTTLAEQLVDGLENRLEKETILIP